MITIKDIAQAAGVSFSTVSKALRHSPLVKPATRDRVLALAEQMGYQPNIAARRLVSKRSGVIGVVWPSLERTALSALITRVNSILEREGYATLLSINEINAAISTFERFQVDAILIFADRGGELNSMLKSDNQAVPVLAYGTTGHLPIPTVDVNRSGAIRLAVRKLAELGHRNIHYIGRPDGVDPLQEAKVAAFVSEMAALRLPCPKNAVCRTSGLEFHDGYSSAMTALQSSDRPSAIISGSYDLTRGILRAAAELDVKVPERLSIISYDNIPQMDALDVPMTVVGASLDAIAETVAGQLLRLIHDSITVDSITIEPELIMRSSVAAPFAG